MGDALDDVSEDSFRIIEVAGHQYRVFDSLRTTENSQQEDRHTSSGDDLVVPSTDSALFGHVDDDTTTQTDSNAQFITAEKAAISSCDVPNYFISIPMTDPALQKNVECLYSEIKSLPFCPYLDPFLIDTSKLHITIAMLVLNSESRVEEAKALLNSLSPEIDALIGDNELQVEFEQTLSSMQPNPSACRVLYAKPTRSTEKLLRPIADLILLSFMKEGFTQLKAFSPTKLHMTILNVRTASKRADESEATRGINVGPVLKLSHRFSVVRPKSIHLSQRHKFDENGYYHSVSKIDLAREKN
ncbi:uncharacterized protein LOC126323760 [Schistocerca gregaria]|uniref:uncharacterized protein LOC126323760 n=1 Tax=Schistocerca gregaria TaxID=7010 RepID=UPI00211EE595|nr:uncharacterized protein LOC126323760 [Schistocerca gregaria]